MTYVIEHKCVLNASQSQVAVLQPNSKASMIANLHGSDIGEYFGASLATGDLNHDGLDDLVIGAPHWKTDNGRVHIYLGTSEVSCYHCMNLRGSLILLSCIFSYFLNISDSKNLVL